MNKMTISEKILARHAGLDHVKPGQLVLADVDLMLANDVTAPLAIDEVRKQGLKNLLSKDKVVLVPDHFTPNKDILSAQHCKKIREFADDYKIKNYFEIGQVGIEHALLPEQGFIKPGMLIIGADSHTCTYGALGAFSTGVGSTDVAFAWVTGKCWFKVPETIKVVFKGKLGKYVGGKDLILYLIGKIGVDGARYKSLEFHGNVIKSLPIDGRLSMCNMAIEAGAKNGIIEPDTITDKYVKEATGKAPKYKDLISDKGAEYSEVYEWDVTDLEPQVAFPHLPSNTMGITAAEKKNIKLDQVVIGSCTNGRISDLRETAKILKGKKVNPKIRTIIFPGTQKIYLQALKEGLLEIFVKAGAVVSPPTCGPCLGGHMGILAEGERALATTNRNFVGRMGHPKSEVYLCNPAVAAASALTGKITDPR
jgi:3-isopropylmalate/(R)-2-methylmalate dehydratase large subunit